jgi:Cu/Ag efflux pump CusA
VGRPLILNYLGKRKERLSIVGKEFTGTMHEGLLVTTAVQVSTASLETRSDCHSRIMDTMKET